MTHKAIFENLLLTDEAKVQLEEAFTTAIQAKTALLEAEYKEKEEEIQESVLATVQDIVSEALADELVVLAEELEHARTLDVQYAEKLELFKENYATTQEDAMRVLVAESVTEEVGELLEDIEYAKKNAFGMQIYEAFKDSFDVNFGVADADVVEKLRAAELQLESYERAKEVERLLEGIGGKERAVLLTLLEGVESDKLEKRFASVKDIVLREAVDTTEPITESVDEPVVAESTKLVVEGVEDIDSLNAAFNKAIGLANRK